MLALKVSAPAGSASASARSIASTARRAARGSCTQWGSSVPVAPISSTTGASVPEASIASPSHSSTSPPERTTTPASISRSTSPGRTS